MRCWRTAQFVDDNLSKQHYIPNVALTNKTDVAIVGHGPDRQRRS
jgi:hypothetical protein